MTFFEDLSPYRYTAGMEHLVNIGWLDVQHPFPTGASEVVFQERLAWLCTQQRYAQMRGVHACNLCEPMRHSYHQVEVPGNRFLLGSAEVRVQGNRRYAAPNLVLHYVIDQGYAPPQEFVDAVNHIEKRLFRTQWRLVRGPME